MKNKLKNDFSGKFYGDVNIHQENNAATYTYEQLLEKPKKAMSIKGRIAGSVLSLLGTVLTAYLTILQIIKEVSDPKFLENFNFFIEILFLLPIATSILIMFIFGIPLFRLCCNKFYQNDASSSFYIRPKRKFAVYKITGKGCPLCDKCGSKLKIEKYKNGPYKIFCEKCDFEKNVEFNQLVTFAEQEQ